MPANLFHQIMASSRHINASEFVAQRDVTPRNHRNIVCKLLVHPYSAVFVWYPLRLCDLQALASRASSMAAHGIACMS